MTGVVKFFNDEKGFGFITQDNGGPDLFVHRNEVNGGALVDGDAVTFTEAYDDRSGKQKAMNVSGGSGGEGGYGGGGFGFGGKGKGKGKSSFGGGSFGGDMECYNCNGFGHMSRDCPEPRKDKGKGKGGGKGKQVCRQFQAGNCSFGDGCRFEHV